MKVQLAPFLSNASGKLDNVVALKLPNSGNILRTRVIPFNPKSADQETARATLTVISQAWGGTLTDSQRAAWDTYATGNPVVNSFGQTAVLSGEDWFVKINSQFRSTGQVTLLTAPPTSAKPSVGTISFGTIETTAIDLEVIGTYPTTSRIRCWLTASLPPGRKAQTPNYRLVESFAGTGTPDQTIDPFTAYAARFGAPVAGRKLWARVDIVDDEGQLSASEFTNATIDP